MRRSRAWAAALGIAAALSMAISGQAAAQPVTGDIIGGGTVGSAPWGAQIYWDNVSNFGGFECSGSIVAAQWVLTAQHCLNSPGMHVRVGNVNLGQGVLVAVNQQVASPLGDMGLLHLASPVSTTFMTLASSAPPVNSTNQIYGWGRTLNQSPPSPVLKTANVRVTGTSRSSYQTAPWPCMMCSTSAPMIGQASGQHSRPGWPRAAGCFSGPMVWR